MTLGEIVLPQNDEFEFNPFEWAQASAIAHAHTLQQMADLKARVSSEQEATAKLNAQLDDLVQTKREAETAMLRQFMLLLNEKKRKMRDQSRLLVSAGVDQATGTSVLARKAYPQLLTGGCSHGCAGNKGRGRGAPSTRLSSLQAQSLWASSREGSRASMGVRQRPDGHGPGEHGRISTRRIG